MLPAACESRNRPAILRRRPRWFHHLPVRRCQQMQFISARYYFGEVSLSGAVRPVAQGAARLKEAAKLGFARAITPEAARSESGEPGLKTMEVATLARLVADIVAGGKAGKAAIPADKTG